MNSVGLLYGVKFSRGSINVIEPYNYLVDNSLYLNDLKTTTKELMNSIEDTNKLNVEVNDKYTKLKKKEPQIQGSGRYLTRYERGPSGQSYNGKSGFAKSFNYGKYR